MAKKATSKSSGGTKAGPKSRAVAKRTSSGGGSKEGMGDAFIKLLQSPLVAELVAVAATAALARSRGTGLRQRRRRVAASARAKR